MPVRILRYLTDIHLAHPGHRVHQGLVYIGAERLTMKKSTISELRNLP